MLYLRFSLRDDEDASLWRKTLCSQVQMYKRVSAAFVFTIGHIRRTRLIMQTANCPETKVSMYQSARCDNPEERNDFSNNRNIM
jgi:hypothetical protein